MFGFSIYLNEDWSDAKEAYIAEMADIGFKGIFTSLHLPEDDVLQYGGRLKQLVNAARSRGLRLMADISGNALEAVGLSIHRPKQIKESGITGLRVDDGIDLKDIAALSNFIIVGVNADTLTESDYENLEKYGANFSRMEAWHNYYPRLETGLDEKWFGEKNKWLKSKGLSVAAFAPGDGELRHPLYETLPTLEMHRHENPLAASLSLLQHYAVDHVYIGDPGLTVESCSQFRQWIRCETILLHAAAKEEKWQPYIFKKHQNRIDPARDVIRSIYSRRENKDADIPPENNGLRTAGSITLDNQLYKRYKGELQIVRRALPPDPKVNVIGRIAARDLPLLPFIQSGTKFEITASEGGK
ncbi:DUF871 domain-containing protein [Weizmannia acidilactici]|uniref:DUF871 domain-containing protein n=1 Tax=Weizmannia acidilactici TaxID=2607726 RepID=UPI00124DAD7F|nr:MupG family TIM beta-alpha barrel fold protein [Weizmannia acidilactici]GER67179.1 hypothetical protein BpJC4_16500 [Weizmannia acidilactici]GER72490.1 hypothetical protein BpPP18_05570 [Weizmannia acidilactici]